MITNVLLAANFATTATLLVVVCVALKRGKSEIDGLRTRTNRSVHKMRAALAEFEEL